MADSGNGAIRRVHGGIVTTLTGDNGPGNVDGVAYEARFSTPIGIARAPDGSCYVADSTNHTIRKVTADGTVSTFAGSASMAGSADGTGPAARFNHPTGVAVDGSGNVYVSDTANNLIRKISPAGVVTTLAGVAGIAGADDGPGDRATFNGPTGLAIIQTSGLLFVADTGNSTIREIYPDGYVNTYAGVPMVAGLRDTEDGLYLGANSSGYSLFYFDALFDHPRALVWDNTGLLFIADSGNAAIRVISHYDGACLTLPLAPGAVTPALSPSPIPSSTPAPTSPTPNPTSGGSSPGGGGAPSVWFVAVLTGAWLLRRLTARRSWRAVQLH